MQKGSNPIDKPIFAYDTGEKLGEKIEDLIFDQENNQLLGFLVDEAGWFSTARVLPLSNVKAIGSDSVIARTANAVVPASEVRDIQEILERGMFSKVAKL